MKSEAKTDQEKQLEKLLAMVLFPIGTAISLAVASAIACHIFGDWISGILGFQPVWWQGLIFGLLVGLVVGFGQSVIGFRRSKAIEEVSTSLGLQRLATDDANDIRFRLRNLLSNRVDFSNCYFKTSDGAHLVVGDLTIQGSGSRSSDGSSSSNPDQVQTCVYFKFDNFEFPEFELKPEGFMLKLLNVVAGVDIDFEDSPLFSKKYFLSGASENAIRQLFNSETRAFFERTPGLRVVANQNQLVVFRPRRVCKPQAIESFVQEAMNAVSVIQESALDYVPSTPGLTSGPPTTKAQALQQASQAPGILSILLKRQIEKTGIDQHEIMEFLKLPVPRQIPQQLKQRFRIDPFLLVFSVVFMFGGFVMLIVASFAEFETQERLIMLVMALVFGMVGGGIFFTCRYFHRRKLQVLARGEILKGKLESVDETSMVIGNQRVYEAKFLPHSDNRESPIKTRFYGCNIQRALNQAESGESTILLRDPNNHGNTLLIECYSL